MSAHRAAEARCALLAALDVARAAVLLLGLGSGLAIATAGSGTGSLVVWNTAGLLAALCAVIFCLWAVWVHLSSQEAWPRGRSPGSFRGKRDWASERPLRGSFSGSIARVPTVDSMALLPTKLSLQWPAIQVPLLEPLRRCSGIFARGNAPWLSGSGTPCRPRVKSRRLSSLGERGRASIASAAASAFSLGLRSAYVVFAWGAWPYAFGIMATWCSSLLSGGTVGTLRTHCRAVQVARGRRSQMKLAPLVGFMGFGGAMAFAAGAATKRRWPCAGR